LHLAGQLIDAASGNVDWGSYRDDSAHELRALVERKLQGHTPNAEPAPAVLPFLQALQQSVATTEKSPPAKRSQRKAPAPKQRKRRA
jgi:non-homologous end joining protein Ku